MKQIIENYNAEIQNVLDNKLATLTPSRSYDFSFKLAKEALIEINKLNNKYNLDIFIMDGVLLGAMREGDFLSHDYDIDLGVFEEKVSSDKLLGIFNDNPHFELVSVDVRMMVVSYRGLTIEIFTHFVENNNVKVMTPFHKWSNSLFSLKKLRFLGMDVLAPENPKKYLMERYGDWENKKIAYDFSYDTLSREYNGLYGLIYLLHRLENAIKNNRVSLASLAVSALYANYNIDCRHIFSMPILPSSIGGIESDTIFFLTNETCFDLNFFNRLEEKKSDNKNLVIGFLGEWQRVNHIIKITSQLTWVTQALHVNSENFDMVIKGYPELNFLYDIGLDVNCLPSIRS